MPIPVFAEMGSVNPSFLLPELLQSDPAGLAERLAGALTMGVGQFCTKPGLVFAQESGRYAAALDAFGIPHRTAPPDAAARGLHSIAEHLPWASPPGSTPAPLSRSSAA